jgi:hypothetical protein
MKRLLAVASAAFLLQTASMVQAADLGFSINVGGPPIVISQPPDFLYPPELGFGVAVGVPYDMFYANNVYYVFRGGGWYRSANFGGGWVQMRPRELPPELRRYKLARIHAFRDREYNGYVRDRGHYRGRAFRPEARAREERRELRQDMREQRHEERREERRDERRDERR